MRFERLNGEAVSVWLGRKIVGLIFLSNFRFALSLRSKHLHCLNISKLGFKSIHMSAHRMNLIFALAKIPCH